MFKNEYTKMQTAAELMAEMQNSQKNVLINTNSFSFKNYVKNQLAKCSVLISSIKSFFLH